MSEKLSVLMTTEGTYPFHQGGVSTWCDILVKQLKSVDYTIFSVTMDPFIAQKFDLGKDTKLIKIPLWGTEEPSEHLDELFSTIYLAKKRTTDEVVQEQFLPLFRELVDELISERKNPLRLADVVVSLYDLFQEYDYKLCFKSPLTWAAYKDMLLQAAEDPAYGFAQPDIYCLIQSLGWIYRFFNIINTPVPKTTVTHSSAAAFCGLPCIISKLKYGTPFLLTEHGVYLREQYLSLSKRGYPSFLNTFLIRMIHSVVGINYAFADQISPVCAYNARWEREFSDRHERIQVIYNGVDHDVFLRAQSVPHAEPTVVTMARIDPIKDITSLLRAAVIVKEKIPQVRFLIYGSVSVPEYYERCLALQAELGLKDTVTFCGHTTDVVKAYESGDIVVQSSISEAFPYSVVEAMLAGKAVVSTDVGGIPEALGEAGILVPPGDPDALARGILSLITQEEYRNELARDARERALSLFTLDKCLSEYLRTYVKLSLFQEPVVAEQTSASPGPATPDIATPAATVGVTLQQLHAERAYALVDAGQAAVAMEQFQLAIDASPFSWAAPVLLSDLAALYRATGDEAAEQSTLYAGEQRETIRMMRDQQQLAERAYALIENGFLGEGIAHLRRAASIYPESAAVPALLLDTIQLYSDLGQNDLAQNELEKFHLLTGEQP